jgi:hypothetical protein
MPPVARQDAGGALDHPRAGECPNPLPHQLQHPHHNPGGTVGIKILRTQHQFAYPFPAFRAGMKHREPRRRRQGAPLRRLLIDQLL